MLARDQAMGTFPQQHMQTAARDWSLARHRTQRSDLDSVLGRDRRSLVGWGTLWAGQGHDRDRNIHPSGDRHRQRGHRGTAEGARESEGSTELVPRELRGQPLKSRPYYDRQNPSPNGRAHSFQFQRGQWVAQEGDA